MKNILGLDIGTNSIGWSVICAETNENGKEVFKGIRIAGSRIIPMDAAILGDFDKGNTKSQTSECTTRRLARRLLERNKLRRERLLRVLSVLGFLPVHYAKQLDRYGKFLANTEPKLAWYLNEEGNNSFLFQTSFEEMLADFHQNMPDLLENSRKIPYDWTIYYLRKKALTEKVSKEELAWILLNFNQKRGYYQLREEEQEEDNTKREEYFALKVIAVEDSGEKRNGNSWYNVKLENGWVYRRASKIPLDWVGKVKEFIVTTELEKDGTEKRDREGNVKRSFRAPKEDDWKLLKTKTEADIIESGKTVGAYIYDTLLSNPNGKIRGKLVRTIERKYYKDELYRILRKQQTFHAELQNRDLYEACIEELYPYNDAHRNLIASRDFTYLFVEDILFYQRPLKSKKSLIADCPYEGHTYIDKKTGEHPYIPLKCIAKSHPLFQEFRLWQFVSYLRIYQKEGVVNGKLTSDIDVTHEFLKSEEDYVTLFDWLNDKKEIKQDLFFRCPLFKLKKNELSNYRWNYAEDKIYPCNETRTTLLLRLEKADILKSSLTREREDALWHLLYSISDKGELVKALRSFAAKQGWAEDSFVDTFRNIPPFEKDYGAYSSKAIKKLLPLMRMGKYWKWENIDIQTQDRINKILTGEYDENIKVRIRDKAIHLTEPASFRGLPVWLACYIVYNRFSEAKEIVEWKSPSDIDVFLQHFKQHSLRNPIVEQVILETLRTVRDIWKLVGHIDEIHVELGREMKNPADKRKKMTQQIQENENTNLRIKALLTEFMNPEFEIENVRPYSPSQQDLLRIYEEGVLNSVQELPDDIVLILRKFNESDIKKRPSMSEVLRYKLWLEQKYRSPYTGAIIPLGKLFTPAYEIEHVIPQSRYFDDSFSNKVVCEAEVNKLKGNMLGYEFIKNHYGEKVPLSNGKIVSIFTVADYEQFVKENYSRNRVKMKKLLMDEIPEQFIARQLNDSRYISNVVKSLLSNVVREEGEEETTSKNLIVCTGSITDRLKKDWGINDVWNKLVLSRFMRLNELTGTSHFTSLNSNGKLIPSMPLELQKGFNKKRIDHRHHAMDAIVIACASRNIVNYLSNESASKNAKLSRYDLQRLLCSKDENGNRLINKPWETFTQDVYAALEEIIVSFKQNLRVLNKTTNHYQHYKAGKKVVDKQKKGDSWAIRKPMHKDTVFGEINLRRIKTVSLKEAIKNPKSVVEKDFKKKLISLLDQGYNEKQIKKYFDDNQDVWRDIDLKKIKVYYFTKETKDRFFAVRKPLDMSFDRKRIEESIADMGIQKILLRHLEQSQNNSELAFSPEGIEEMNRNIIALNNGKIHQPIYNVRVYEKADKFAVGQSGNKIRKFVEAAKGTNLFFAIYETMLEDKQTGQMIRKRSFATIPLNVVIDRQKQGLPSAPEDVNGNLPKFLLSPNDLVYVPTAEEIKIGKLTLPLDKKRIYKMVSCTGNEGHFVPMYIANPIIQVIELGSNNKAQRAWSGEMIKEVCIPIKVDRLGNIVNNF